MFLSLIWLIFLVFLIVYFSISWALLYHLKKFGLKIDPRYKYLKIIFLIGSLILIIWGTLALIYLNNFQ